MKLSARIFQTYEVRSSRLRHQDGSFSYLKAARRSDLPVFIDELPSFEPSATYQIRITSKDNTLRATVTKKVNELASKKLPQGESLFEKFRSIRWSALHDAIWSLAQR
jgi:hypothetical protein